ncbi:hypothetical protein E1180_19265 [Roseibium denhamense]|uniref:Uncharacterized protein n=1 Tax=Roseibium denhamense TaxID=76305 RepID=A0ABY1P3R3_9HYPH|nr:hypothetical protein [Roseibium denhamense]MTI07645.1 hypothetical protein [Roseibium denhamense]SMP24285.1 hypothetical protein SAMN06265374_2411 [Roseibium denhamense]
MKTIIKGALIAATLASLTTGAVAKDWIEKVEVKKDGIDVIPVEVSANSNAYTGIASNSHRFLLRLYGKATSGERIVAMKVGSFKGVRYFEADGSLWSKSFKNRDVGSGTKRSVAITYKPVLPLNKVRWQGWDPRQACALNMDKKIKSGMTKAQVLSKTWTVTAKAYFELDAVAAKKGKAKNNKWNIKNTTDQRDGYGYEVRVKCRKGV